MVIREERLIGKTIEPGVKESRRALVTRKILKNENGGLFIAAVLLFVVLSLSSDSFLTQYNIFNTTRTLSLYLFIALTQAIILVGGGMSLSVGAIAGLSTIAAGYCLDTLGIGGPVAIVIGILVGCAAGAFNGFMITKTGLSAFVVTLATSFVYTGFVFGITNGYAFTNIPVSFTLVGRGNLFGLPISLYLIILTLVLISVVFRYTLFGRRLLATGDNLVAARLSGINTNRIIFLSHVLSGLFSAIAALVYISRMSSAQPAAGQNWLIVSFAIAIIGGTALNGGTISMIGLLLGGIIMVLIKNGLILLKVNVYYEQVFFGMLILLAVGIDRVRTFYTRKDAK
jgi:ribose transport system permease protein